MRIISDLVLWPEDILQDQREEMSETAISTIIFHLFYSIIRLIDKEDTPAKVCKKLEKMFQSRSLSNKIYMKERFFGFRMYHAKSLEANLEEFLNITIELANSGDKEELSNKNKAIIIFNSLPEVKSAIKYERSSIIIDEVIFAVKSKDLEIEADMKTSGDFRNHMARGKQQCKSTAGNNFKSKNHDKASTKINTQSTNFNADKKRFFCNKMDHIKKDCYSWIKNSKENQANTSQGHQDSENFGDGYNDGKVFMELAKLKD